MASGKSLMAAMVVAALVPAVGAPLKATELYRLNVDLDGDGEPERVRISTQPLADKARAEVAVTIAEQHFRTEFFSAEGDLPEFSVVWINRDRPQRQLLLGAHEAGFCVFHLLSYVDDALLPLLRWDAGPNCERPVPRGNGELTATGWMGFWARDFRFRLSDDGTTLTQLPPSIQPLSVAGLSASGLTLEPAECADHVIAAGTLVQLLRYDESAERYWVQVPNGACGWIPASELGGPNPPITQLPWAR